MVLHSTNKMLPYLPSVFRKLGHVLGGLPQAFVLGELCTVLGGLLLHPLCKAGLNMTIIQQKTILHYLLKVFSLAGGLLCKTCKKACQNCWDMGLEHKSKLTKIAI